MQRLHLILIAAMFMEIFCTPHCVIADTFGSGDNSFDIELITIGNPGNPPDLTGDPDSVGSVDYVYRIGKFEISRGMVDKANAEGELDISLHNMSNFGGNGPDQPATGISWIEAATFVNYLNSSSGYPAAYKFNEGTFELWQPGDTGYDADNPYRNRLTRYVLPTMDEWYKSAYYDPNANGGAGGYWDFPTGSDSEPVAVLSGTTPGTAIFDKTRTAGPARITQAGGLSPYGTMAQGGNVWELEETEWDLVNDSASAYRDKRGGDWHEHASKFSSLLRSRDFPFREWDNVGFRVASIPEPSSLMLCALGMLALSMRSRRSH